MKILIDTHCWLWLCASPERFSESILARLPDPRTDRLLSWASVWEMVIKYQPGRLPLPLHPGGATDGRRAGGLMKGID